MSATGPTTMQVKVFAPFKIYFEGPAASISAVNETGAFDILPRHKNFMSLLKPCVLTVREPGKQDFAMDVDRGIMHVKTDKVTVFLDI
jgi:F0F1-type ATP synthase epsilon subunit